jgi:hypothetical protein
MAHRLVTDEMVEKAYRTYWDANMRAALEAVTDEIVEACARELDKYAANGAYGHGPPAVVRRLKGQAIFEGEDDFTWCGYCMARSGQMHKSSCPSLKSLKTTP